MGRSISNPMLDFIKMLAPGTPLRSGLDNILRAKTGALIVGSDAEKVLEIVDGGFALDVDFSPTALYELAKMDGAIILSRDLQKIRFANVHLVPSLDISSSETGIRHRTAERVAKQTSAPVIAISQRRNVISLYQGNYKYVLRDIGMILTKANQAIMTLEKYRSSLDQALANLSALEFEDSVTMSDITTVIQRSEMVLRIADEIEQYAIELGSEGRLINLQVDELVDRVEQQAFLVLKDYGVFDEDAKIDDAAAELQHQIQSLSNEELLDHLNISKILGYGGTVNSLDLSISPAGYRLLNQIPRIPTTVVNNIVDKFGFLQKVLRATLEELDEVEGIGEVRARAIKDGLRRLQEQAFTDRHY